MSILKSDSQLPAFKQSEIVPYGKLGNQINRNKVFKDKIGLFYPKPINRNNSINEQGEFDTDKFFFSRTGYQQKRNDYLEKINHTLLHFKRLQEKGYLDDLYLLQGLDEIKKAFEEMYIVGQKDEGIYSKDFYLNIKNLIEHLRAQDTLLENNDCAPLLHDIQKNINECLTREKKEREILIKEVKKVKENGIKKYVKEDENLNVDKIVEDINSHRERNEEFMLMALYTAKCSKSDLTKLQNGVIEALNKKVKRLDTFKVFIIIERILPYIHDEFKIDWNLPEIFRPEYLNKINIYNLDIDGFTAQVKHKAKENNRPEEIQTKLIDQFKLYGQSESGKIGFGQGSEQLRYRNGVTGGVTERDFQYYLKEPNLGEEKRPIPNILKNNISDQKDDLVKALE